MERRADVIISYIRNFTLYAVNLHFNVEQPINLHFINPVSKSDTVIIINDVSDEMIIIPKLFQVITDIFGIICGFISVYVDSIVIFIFIPKFFPLNCTPITYLSINFSPIPYDTCYPRSGCHLREINFYESQRVWRKYQLSFRKKPRSLCKKRIQRDKKTQDVSFSFFVWESKRWQMVDDLSSPNQSLVTLVIHQRLARFARMFARVKLLSRKYLPAIRRTKSAIKTLNDN